MKLLRLPLILACVVTVDAYAELLQNWQFRDRANTPLSQCRNMVRGGARWSADFHQSVSNGRGQFVIKRRATGATNAYAEIKPLEGDNEIPHWLVVKIPGWQFAGTRANQFVRIGFSANNPERNPSAVATLRISNNDSGKVCVRVETRGSGAQAMEAVEMFNNPHQVPLTFAMKLDPTQNTFELYLSANDGKTFNLIGRGKTPAGRVARYLRFGVNGAFSLPNAIFLIDDIRLQTDSPLPATE